jgi:hypothetical protein
MLSFSVIACLMFEESCWVVGLFSSSFLQKISCRTLGLDWTPATCSLHFYGGRFALLCPSYYSLSKVQ